MRGAWQQCPQWPQLCSGRGRRRGVSTAQELSGTNPTWIWILGVHGIWVHDAGTPARAPKRESICDLLTRIRDRIATFQIMYRMTIHNGKQNTSLRLYFVCRTINIMLLYMLCRNMRGPLIVVGFPLIPVGVASQHSQASPVNCFS